MVSGVEALLLASRETSKSGKEQDDRDDNNDPLDGDYKRRMSDSSDYGSGHSNSDNEPPPSSPFSMFESFHKLKY